MRPAILALVILSARPAVAGMCGPTCWEDEVANLEKRAANKTAEGQPSDGIFVRDSVPILASDSPKLIPRVVKACDAILAIEPDDRSCVDVAAHLGKADLGSHDIVAALGRRENKVRDSQTIDSFAALGSARVAPLVIARWKQLASEMAKHERDEDLMNAWAAWRGLAAQALSAGAKDARAFLAEQAATPKIDRGVKRACDRAIAAIDKRTH